MRKLCLFPLPVTLDPPPDLNGFAKAPFFLGATDPPPLTRAKERFTVVVSFDLP